MIQNTEVTACSECGCSNLSLDTKTGDLICNNCGIVMEEKKLAPSFKHMEFYHTGGLFNILLENKGLGSSIKKGEEVDFQGRDLSPKMKSKMKRIGRWNYFSIFKEIRSGPGRGMNEIRSLCDTLQLPRAPREEAAKLMRKCVRRDFLRGRDFENVAGAIVYLVLRMREQPRRLQEITEKNNLEKRKVARFARTIKRLFHLKLPKISAVSFVPEIASKLEIDFKKESKAYSIIKRYEKNRFLCSGKDPAGTAAAAVYLVSNRTQEEICESAGVTEVTLRSRKKEILELIGEKTD